MYTLDVVVTVARNREIRLVALIILARRVKITVGLARGEMFGWETGVVVGREFVVVVIVIVAVELDPVAPL